MNDKWVVKRCSIEEQFHDLRAANLGEDALYASGILNHADQYALDLLRDVDDKVVVDCGCGTGKNAVYFAKAGAMVFAFDISLGMVEATKRLAQENGVLERVNVVKMAAEDLAYPSGFADLVFGHSILHHLDIPVAIREIHRILKVGGRAVFLEPLGHNPMINLFRRFTPSRRTVTEVPLTSTGITFITGLFTQSSHREFYLCGLLAFLALPCKSERLFRAILSWLTGVDNLVLGWCPYLRRYCWVTVIELVK